MKKLILFLGFALTFAANARADICSELDDQTASKAVGIIQKQKEIYQYCSICSLAEPKILKVKNIQNGNPISVNGQDLDLAHTYYKQGDKFINLGVAAGCIQADEHQIKAQLDDLPLVHRTAEESREDAKKKTQDIFNQCDAQNPVKEHMTTSDIVERSAALNDCLADAIKQEIKKGFNVEQQEEMIKDVKQLRKFVSKFYYGIYALNKYCIGGCGTITRVLPYADEGKLLEEMLESLIYLNIAQEGY